MNSATDWYSNRQTQRKIKENYKKRRITPKGLIEKGVKADF